jgi:EAL domain-containing protein (putative c-di-GMP-specific phosphodiesterase class I)
MSINLSPRQLFESNIVDVVSASLANADLPPSSVILELTEGVMVKDTTQIIDRLNQLKALGVQLAVDDFGTGYSSLSYLRRFPIDVLKIDRSFVAGVKDSVQKQALLRTIVELGRTLQLETVAEGIELPEEMHQVRSLECDLGQGFYFARPVDALSVSALLRKGELRKRAVLAAAPKPNEFGEKTRAYDPVS